MLDHRTQRVLMSFVVLMACLALCAAGPALVASASENAELAPIQSQPGDWPWWRGRNHNGVADSDQHPPLEWSNEQHIVWRSPVPGRGHGSPIVVGEQVLLTAADHERNVQTLLCFDRATGKQIWEGIVHRGGLDVKIRDCGRGIARPDLGRVFDLFYTTREEGTGIGLAIVQRIVALHGGQVQIASNEVDGTAVATWLPLNIPLNSPHEAAYGSVRQGAA